MRRGRRHPGGARRAARAGAGRAVPARARCSPRRTTSTRSTGPGEQRLRPHRTTRPGARWRRRSASWRAADALVFASGQAAITALLLAVLRPGDTVVLPSDGYFTVRAFADGTLRGARRASSVLVPTAGPYPSFDGVRLVLLETPANPGLDVCDIRAAGRRARTPPARWSRSTTPPPTPLGQRPLDARRRPGGRLRHQGADRPLRPAARLRGDQRRRSCSAG